MVVEYIHKTNSMMRIIEMSIRENWDYPVWSDYNSDVHFTYGEVAREFNRLHECFRKMGLEPGDRIAICDKNSARWAIAYFAAFTFGAVTVPILNDFNGEQIRNILAHCEAKLLICSKAVEKKISDAYQQQVGRPAETKEGHTIAEANENIDCAVMDIMDIGTKPVDQTFHKADVHYFNDNPDDLAMLSYTSGSTGHSKGVMIPYRAIWSNTRFADEKLGVQPHMKFLSLLPLAHMYGYAFEFMYAFTIGCHTIFLTKIPSPTVVVQAFAEIKPWVVIAVPLIIEKIVRGKVFPVIRAMRMRTLLTLPGVKTLIYRKIRKQLIGAFGGNLYEVIVGGAAFSTEVEDFLKKIKFPYTVGYGMTECAPIICYRDWKTFAKHSCGQPAPRMEVKVLSEDPTSIPGEIVTRGTNVMLGYYKDDAATAAAIDEEGWLHTGDLGTIDSDQNVFIRGRSKNMLLGANGQNIYPEEIEEKITTHALIDECVVVQRGEKLVALVYTSDDTLKKHGMTRDDFNGQLEQYRRHINRLLPSFYALSAFEARDEEFEKTPKRNIRRFLYK